MELLIVILVLFFSYKVFTRPKENVYKDQGETIKHGHRCYAEGLDISEKAVVDLLSHGLSHKEYFIFNNLIIPSTNSDSTQIDHIVLSRFGVFVIETKGYNGWIYAHQNREKWTVTYPTGKKHHFFNPLWQNYGHLQALKKAMPFIEDNFFEIVVFVGQCEFKTPRIDKVVYENELVEIIQKRNTPKISEQCLLMAIGKLSYMCQVVDITAEQHVANIRQILQVSQKIRQH